MYFIRAGKISILDKNFKQVRQIGFSLATKFLNSRNKNKVIVNLVDQFETENNCGFNLINFKPELIKDYFTEVT